MEDTIVGIATALGKGAISIIRISGNNSLKIINKHFSKKITSKNDHTINYGFFQNEKEIIDEVLIMYMKGPKSYTAEDVIEINCHGGIACTNKILELILNAGARLAEPGEFTKRALLNGRINMLQAEAVMDMINSKTESARKMAVNQLSGKTSSLIRDLRKKILDILANIEVNIDYPEYEDAIIYTNQLLKVNINDITQEIKKILEQALNGKIIKEGLNVLILGKPNVGKSSILNHLLEEEKAIVTDIAGTTRDIVEGAINLKGVVLNFIDTAGIHQTDDIIEKKGIEKSFSYLKEAHLILYVLDNDMVVDEEDKKILEQAKEKEIIIVINKCDDVKKISLDSLKNYKIVEATTFQEKGLDSLKASIIEKFNLEKLEAEDLTYLSNARCINLLKQVETKIKDIEKAINKEVPIDIIEIDVKKIFDLLGEIIGESYTEELLDQLFSNFCLGK